MKKDIEKYAKRWVEKYTDPPCKLADDPKGYNLWYDKLTKEYRLFLATLPSEYIQKRKTNYLGIKEEYLIAIPELAKQIRIEFKIKKLEQEGYVIKKR